MTTLQKIRDAFYNGKTYFIRHNEAIYECRAKKLEEVTELGDGFKTVIRTLTVEIPSHNGKTELELKACDFFNCLENRTEKIILFENPAAAIAQNEEGSIVFPLRCDAEIAKTLGISTAKAMLCSSRVEADGKEFKNGIISERKWHEVLSLARSFKDEDEFDSGKFCTTFIERCMSLFTNRKALVRALNVRRRKKILWFRL